MKPGTKVVMTEELKRRLRGNGSGAHVDEFGECVGIVIGPTSWGSDDYDPGPEVDVKWQPSNLRYAYDPRYLRTV